MGSLRFGFASRLVEITCVGLLFVGSALAAPSSAGLDPAAASAGSANAVGASWLTGVQQQLTQLEYHARQHARGLQAPNRSLDLRFYFERDGVRAFERRGEAQGEQLSLALAGVARGEQTTPVGSGTLHSKRERVEIRRHGIVEWYLNGPAGLEHGFTLDERPEGHGALALELRVGRARAALRDGSVVFATPSGRRLEYGKLAAWDAKGRSVPARLEVPSPQLVRLVLADAGATYPLVVDPLLTETADTKLRSDQAAAAQGTSVAAAGDVNGDGFADVIVGAPGFDVGPGDEGAAFVYEGSASGIASQPPASPDAQLDSDQIGARFGESVAGAGDVNGDGYDDVIVGAPAYADPQADEGAAFVFHGSATGVASGDATTAASQLESDQVGAELGSYVAAAGDVNGDGYADVIVGAPFYDETLSGEGSAFVFHGSAAGVPDGDPLTADSQFVSVQLDANLGPVAGAGDLNGDGLADVIVGIPQYDSGQANEGVALVFHGDASGISDGNPGTADAQIELDQVEAALGASVGAAGDVNGDGFADAIVGAPDWNQLVLDEGAAFVFHGSATGIVDPNNPDASLGSSNAFSAFGAAVGGAGDVNGDGFADVVVGAPLYDSGEMDEGLVFVYQGSGNGLVAGDESAAFATLQVNDPGAEYGSSVAIAGDVDGDGFADVIAGAPNYTEAQVDEGAAFVYLGGSKGIVNADAGMAAAELRSGDMDALLGTSVAGAGDVNGDGYADVIVGAPSFDTGGGDAGAAFVFEGSSTGIGSSPPGAPDAQLESDQLGARFGVRVAGAGDVNGDGYADVIVGAAAYADPQADEGAAFVFHGSASGVSSGTAASADAQLESNQVGAELGTYVAGAGDVNGDGYADVIVGAPLYDETLSDEGSAFVFHGSTTGIASGDPGAADSQFVSGQVDGNLGPVASAGDVNGDGLADVITGVPGYDAGQTNEGVALVFHGDASGIADGSPGTADAQLELDQAEAGLGASVAAAGDVNGDGFGDVIVGAPGWDQTSMGSNQGAAFVFHGSSTGIFDPGNADTLLFSVLFGASFGFWVGSAGDVNADGYADVIVGAPLYSFGEVSEGAAFVYPGSDSGVAGGDETAATGGIESNQAGAELGTGVAGAGDVNGDGFGDVIVGAPNWDNAATNEGGAFVYLGNANRTGRDVRAQQLRGDASGIHVEPWGASEDGLEFEVEMTATHPAGRGRVKLEIEACPEGLAFGDVGCTVLTGASWTDVTATAGGVVLNETVGGLSPDSLYRWRSRVLYAPFTVTEPGITPPPNPAHGPWRRVSGQAVEADVRALPEPSTLLGLALGLGLLRVLRGRYRGTRR